MRVKPVKVGLIGSGAISGIYLKNMTQTFSITEVVGCSDIIPERSKRRAEEYGIRQMTNEEIFNDPEIELVVNTTYPLSHYKINKEAILAGKHVHCEKMMAVGVEEGKELIALAKEKNLRIGMAPDTFLGGGYQTARLVLDSGMIGDVVLAQALIARGYTLEGESDTNASFVMLPGGGIPFDMGGYYLHALVSLLGPISRVTGFAGTREADRPYLNPRNPSYTKNFHVDTLNMLAASLEFKSGILGTFAATSDNFGETGRVELYGTKGTLICPNPNEFGGPVIVKLPGSEPREMPITHSYTGDTRGIGVAELAWAIRRDRPHRASGAMGFHAFEAIHGINKSGVEGKVHVMESTCDQPLPLMSGHSWGAAAERFLDS